MHEVLRVPSPEPFSQTKQIELVRAYWAPDGAALALQFLIVDPGDARSAAKPDDFFEVESRDVHLLSATRPNPKQCRTDCMQQATFGSIY